MAQVEVLHREIIHQQGSFCRVIDYIEGHHPKLGILNGYKTRGHGWSAEETICEHDVVTPLGIIKVIKAT
jgi:hypothetical protein